MTKLIKILSIFFIASLVIPALGETKMLKAERTAAELDRVEAEIAGVEGKVGSKEGGIEKLSKMLEGKNPDEAIGILNKAKGSKLLFHVDETLKASDEAADVLINGIYQKNPTITKVEDLTINPSGTIRGKTRLDPKATTTDLLNGQEYIYVIDENGNLIIGTRAKGFNFSKPDGKAPHPTLIGGSDPVVQAAGTIEFRGGKIYKVDNVSGHYKPSAESLKKAEEIFRKDFPANSFDKDFKGFIPYGN